MLGPHERNDDRRQRDGDENSKLVYSWLNDRHEKKKLDDLPCHTPIASWEAHPEQSQRKRSC